MITPEELNQIGIALFGSIKFNTYDGHMISLEQAYNVLNAHCNNGRIAAESVVVDNRRMVQFRFWVVEETPNDPVPVAEPDDEIAAVLTNTEVCDTMKG